MHTSDVHTISIHAVRAKCLALMVGAALGFGQMSRVSAQGSSAERSATAPTASNVSTATTTQWRAVDLNRRTIDLNYADADTALSVLRGLGFNVLIPGPERTSDSRSGEVMGDVTQSSSRQLSGMPRPQRTFSADDLPLIMKLPSPDARQLTISMPNDSSRGGREGRDARSEPGSAAQADAVLAPVVASPTARLIVLTAPNASGDFERVAGAVRDLIDHPVPQVYIQALLVDITTDALRDLGVRWDIKKGSQSVSVGAATTLAPGAAVLALVRDSLAAVSPSQILARINALAEKNHARILGRPSILTLDNRQATFRVGTDIPVATSKDAGGGSNSSRVSFTFQYIPVGATLNVRPRVALAQQEVTLAIDSIVSSAVANQDLRVLDPTTGAVLASAPALSQRKVQTFARVKSGETLIVAGLTSNDTVESEDKVPGLGEIPVAGKLFGHESRRHSRREVILIITPTIIVGEVPPMLRFDASTMERSAPAQ